MNRGSGYVVSNRKKERRLRLERRDYSTGPNQLTVQAMPPWRRHEVEIIVHVVDLGETNRRALLRMSAADAEELASKLRLAIEEGRRLMPSTVERA